MLRHFAEGIRTILGGQYVGLYLYGSLALGDLDPIHSDIDFLVVTEGELSETTTHALGELHARFDQSGSPWSGRIEAAYIARQALNHPGPTPAAYPQVEKGAALFTAPLEAGWPFQRHTLRERGVLVAGPPPRSLIDPVAQADMRRAAAEILGGWQRQSVIDPDWLAWARERGCLAFVVLTICRMLYSLETGSVASKPAAARWPAAQLGPRWASLIDRALVHQYQPGEAEDREVDEMLAFLAYGIRRSRLE